MAALEQTAARSAYTTQALATLGVDPIWDAALTDYLRLEALEHAAYTYGALPKASEEVTATEQCLLHKYGTSWRQNPSAAKELDPYLKCHGDAEAVYDARYCKPYWEASRVLARTPAPTLAAALFKVAMIGREDLGCDVELEDDLLGVIESDMARLMGHPLG